MKLNLTKEQLSEKLYDMTSSNFIDFLVDSGLTLRDDLPDIPIGIYRRVEGQDLARYDGYGYWNSVDIYTYNGGQEIVWNINPGAPDWWVQVLDSLNQPVVNGVRIQMDRTGKRVG